MNKKLPRRKCLACNTTVKRVVDIYCNNKCQRNKQWEITLEKILLEGRVESIDQARHYFKDVLSCMICNTSIWCGQSIALLIDHIDGHADNWLLSNLRKICPNCDAQLPTFKGRNKGNGRHSRVLRYAAGKSY